MNIAILCTKEEFAKYNYVDDFAGYCFEIEYDIENKNHFTTGNILMFLETDFGKPNIDKIINHKDWKCSKPVMMTMREAIEQDLNFEYNNLKYFGFNAHGGLGLLMLLKHQDDKVVIIK